MKTKKSYYQLERIVRGVANHRRIEILELLQKKPELSVLDISEILHINFKTASEHIRRLAATGMIPKRSDGNAVRNRITDRGSSILKFLRILE
jgi:Mn-dependent DtxR family transcriptional regulator